MSENKSDILKAIEAMLEAQREREQRDDKMYFMNKNDFLRYTSNLSGSERAWFQRNVRYSDFVDSGKIYGVPRESLQIKFPEIKFPERSDDALGSIFTPYYRGYSWGQRIAKKINPNWSMEWDEWRNTGKYQWLWMNRLGHWINRQLSRLHRP